MQCRRLAPDMARLLAAGLWLAATGSAATSPEPAATGSAATGSDATSPEPAETQPHQLGRYMKLWVCCGGETITLTDPMGRVAEATDKLAWSRIPACSTGVNQPFQADESYADIKGGFFVVREPLVGIWTLRVERDAASLPEERGPNVTVYAERHELSGPAWAVDRDRAWLARADSLTWRVEVRPASTPADSSWLRLTRLGEGKR